MPNLLNLAEAIEVVREFFVKQCGRYPLTFWHVLEAIERLEKGVYVIKCGEHCALEVERRHEVWVDTQTGEIVHSVRIDLPPPTGST